MLNISSDILNNWVLGLLLPMTRILGFVSIVPILGHRAIPKRVKIGLALMITLILMPILPNPPPYDIMSVQGIVVIMEQVVIGVAMGFVISIVFSGIELAGQLSGMTMGLGFASFFDPQSRGSTIVISQFFGVLALLVFISIDGHLMVISTLVDSFEIFPIGMQEQSINFKKVAAWGGQIFSIGLQLALPVICALLVTNLALGILTRTAPQLNLFGIGFPITIGVGFLVIFMALPYMATPLKNYIESGIAESVLILKK